jgi:MarR family transcriptional regulator, organic hydroperoxide resistance regulator
MAATTKPRRREAAKGGVPIVNDTCGSAPTLEQQVFLDLLRLNSSLVRAIEQILGPYDLSNSQYNVLRILRGAGSTGLACGEVGGRMVTHDPDITRLLDRLEARSLIARARQLEDRRVVKTSITPEGLRMLEELDAPICALHQRQFSGIPQDQLAEMAKMLATLRAKWESSESSGESASAGPAERE